MSGPDPDGRSPGNDRREAKHEVDGPIIARTPQNPERRTRPRRVVDSRGPGTISNTVTGASAEASTETVDIEPAPKVERARSPRPIAIAPEPERDGVLAMLSGEWSDLRYFVALAILVLLAAILWAVWGLGVASPVLFLLALGLLAAWLLL